MKRRTIYCERYKPFTAVPTNGVEDIAGRHDAAYVIEQGEVEIPALENQRRQFVTIRFERIVATPPVEGVSPQRG